MHLLGARKRIYYELVGLAAIGIVAQVLEVEILYSNGFQHNIWTTVLKTVVSVSTLVSVPWLYNYYGNELETGKVRKLYDSFETIWSTGLGKPLALEMLILVIHPLPFLCDGTFELTIGHLGVSNIYTWDALLSLVVISRSYLVFRAIHFHIGYSSAPGTRVLATMNKVSLGPSYTFKHMMRTRPFEYIGLFTLYVTIILAYALRVAESPHNEDLEWFVNCVWMIIITATTVG